MNPTIEDIKKLAAQINAIDDLSGLISVNLSTYGTHKKSVHMGLGEFKEVFTAYSRKIRSLNSYELFINIDGVRFYCIETVELDDTVEEISTEPEE
ncbi:MAG: hypothetical protein PVG39_02180 [Desulfobacteraceae bacterium]|jgi:hypothetical protein